MRKAPWLAEPISISLACGIIIPHKWRARRSLNCMPKRGTDAASRCFFDELRSLTASRLRATGAIRLEDRQGIIAFGDEDKAASASPTRNSPTAAHGAISLSAMWRQEKEALARRRCAALPELLLVLRRAVSLGLRLRPK